MSDYYADIAGSNTAPYDTWAKAATDIQTVLDLYVAGDDIWARGTFTLSVIVDDDQNTGSIAAGYMRVTGCNAAGVDDGTRAVLDGNSAVVNCLRAGTGKNFKHWKNFEFKNATSDGFTPIGAHNNWIFENCKFANNGRYGASWASSSQSRMIKCEFSSNTNVGQLYGVGNTFINCIYKNNGNYGAYTLNSQLFYGCLFHNNTTAQIYQAGYDNNFISCIIDGWNGAAAAGIGINHTVTRLVIYNCRITNCVTGIQLVAGDEASYDYCGFYGNTNDTSVHADGLLIDGGHNVAMAAHGYNDLSNDDFNLVAAAELRNTQIDIDTVNKFFITAGLNPEEAGGGLLSHRGMTGGING